MSQPTAEAVTSPDAISVEKVSEVQSSNPEAKQTESVTAQIPYTTLTRIQKLFLTFLLGLTTLASPLTATIYLPLLPLLQVQFHTSVQAINLTITLYIIIQALSPAIFATLSDSLGRRPVSLLTYAIYTIASLGLTLNRSSYPALLVLRALQALGASACIAVAYGVIADVSMPNERGKMLGPVTVATNLGTCIGPVIGGWVAYGSGGYEWVFWALLIFGVFMTLLVGFGMVETAREVVGNGTKPPRGWYGYTWTQLLFRTFRSRDTPPLSASAESKPKLKLPNPLAPMRIIFYKDTILILWLAGAFYANWYAVQASIPYIYGNVYHWNTLDIGLAYLPGAVGVTLGGYINGKLLDYKYRLTAKEIGHTIDKVQGDNLDNFPIEKARSRGWYYLLAPYVLSLAGLGWSITAHSHPSIPLVLQCIIGFTGTCFFVTFNTLLVDIFSESPSTAAASGNLTRCALAAAWVAILEPLVNVMGYGWFYTLWSIVVGIGVAGAVVVLKRWGMKWRSERRKKSERKSEDLEASVLENRGKGEVTENRILSERSKNT